MPPRTYDFSSYRDPSDALLTGAAGAFKGVYDFVQQAKAAQQDADYKKLLANILVRNQQIKEADDGFGPDATAGGTAAPQVGNQTQSGAGVQQQRQAADQVFSERPSQGGQPVFDERPRPSKQSIIGRLLGGSGIPDLSPDLGPRRGPTLHERDMATAHGYDLETLGVQHQNALDLEGMRERAQTALENLRGQHEMDRAQLLARRGDATERRQENMAFVTFYRTLLSAQEATTRELAKNLPSNGINGVFDARSPEEKQQAIADYRASLQKENQYRQALAQMGEKLLGVNLADEPTPDATQPARDHSGQVGGTANPQALAEMQEVNRKAQLALAHGIDPAQVEASVRESMDLIAAKYNLSPDTMTTTGTPAAPAAPPSPPAAAAPARAPLALPPAVVRDTAPSAPPAAPAPGTATGLRAGPQAALDSLLTGAGTASPFVNQVAPDPTAALRAEIMQVNAQLRDALQHAASPGQRAAVTLHFAPILQRLNAQLQP